MVDPRPAALAAVLLCAACAGPEILVENDSIGFGRGSDQNYTSGLRAVLAMPRDEAPEWARRVANGAFFWRDEPSEALALSIGQNIYTPEDTQAEELIEDDRPYAGWLYGGIAAYDAIWGEDPIAARDRQTTLELVIGLIGPHSYAEEVQNFVHDVIGSDEAQGWDNQLEDELTAMLSVEWQNRVWRRTGDHFGADAITHLGGSAGTPFTMAATGCDLRFGYGLPRDFGVSVNEPRLVTTAAVGNEQHQPSLYIFTGIRGQAVAWNSFIQGNLFHDSHSVDLEPWVADFKAGLAWQHGRWRINYAWVYRTDEFQENPDDGSVFGSLGFSWSAN